MMRRTRAPALSAISMLVTLLAACGSSESPQTSSDSDASSVSTGSSGAVNTTTGGNAGNGGSTGSGGSMGSAGSMVTSTADASSEAATVIPPPSTACAPLPMSGKIVEITNPGSLVATVYDAAAGTTFLLA